MATDAERELHRRLAGALFNQTQELLEKDERTPEEDELMVHSAHASRYHWSQVGDATNFAIGDWLLSRVYSVLDRPEPALWYAGLSLETSVENDLEPFYTAHAYESLARAFAISAEVKDAQEALNEAQALMRQVHDEADRVSLKDDLEEVRRLIALESGGGSDA